MIMNLEKQITEFINNSMPEWLRDTVLKEAVRFSYAANMPQSFVDGIKITNEGKYRLENEWSENNKPLAVYFEFGTRDHWIAPKDPKGVLAWKSKGTGKSRHGSAIYYKNSTEQKGDMIFSKGHYVSGLPRLEPMTQGYKLGMRKLKELIPQKVKEKFEGDHPDKKIKVRV